MKISVIIPVYNVDKYLAQCLESIVYQTHKDLEIIIIDDGSPDNSSAIYNRYAAADSRIKIITQENAGVSAARNIGIDTATGEYVHFIDSDDYLIDLDYYERMLGAATAVDADMAVSGFYFQERPYDSCSYQRTDICIGIADKIRLTDYFEHAYIWRYLFRREFLVRNDLKFAIDMDIFEDAHFGVRALEAANKVVSVPDVSYYYRWRRDSRIGQSKDNHSDWKKYSQLLRFYTDFSKKHGCENLTQQRFTKTIYSTIFNIPLMTVVSRDRDGFTKYYLLGFIRIMKRRLKNVL